MRQKPKGIYFLPKRFKLIGGLLMFPVLLFFMLLWVIFKVEIEVEV